MSVSETAIIVLENLLVINPLERWTIDELDAHLDELLSQEGIVDESSDLLLYGLFG